MIRPWVIKAGGELMASASAREKILSDLAKLSKKNPLVFVHGGGTQIEAELLKNNIQAEFVGGRRVTSPEAMVIVEQVLSGHVNKMLASELITRKAKAVGLSGRDGGMIIGKPIENLGRAARPLKVNTSLLTVLIDGKFLPVVSSVGSDSDGNAVNINADDAASALAIALKAKHLIFLTDISGVLDQYKKTISILKVKEIQSLIDLGVIKGGMIPKVQSAHAAIKKGVGEVDIINGFKGIMLDNGTRIMK